ncbi:MAG TPA: heme exporter protein CcmB [Gammaproteobacteria bacterium]|nr:heme exporter protein CcmB [Gammaproteobacteria bacterium]
MNYPSLASAMLALLRRDLLLAYRARGELINPLIFFALVVSLFPLATSPEPGVLRLLAPGIIWVSALLATLLSLEQLFRSDYDDGSLEQLLLSPHPLPLLALVKIAAHWLVTGLPLVIVAPLLGAMLNLPSAALSTLAVGLLLGTPILSAIGAIGAALTVSLRRGGMLLSLLILPLYVPVLVFAAAAVEASAAGLSARGQLYLLAGLMLLSLTLAPIAIAAALRISSD